MIQSLAGDEAEVEAALRGHGMRLQDAPDSTKPIRRPLGRKATEKHYFILEEALFKPLFYRLHFFFVSFGLHFS